MLGHDLAELLDDPVRLDDLSLVDLDPALLVSRETANFADIDVYSSEIRANPPKAIIHCAAYTDVDGCEIDKEKAWKDNVEYTKLVVEHARRDDAVLLYVSTDYVFDGSARSPIPPSAVAKPINEYGRTKFVGEKVILESGLEHLIVRTSWLFGWHGNNFVEAIRRRAQVAPSLEVVDDQVGTPTFTYDLAPALLKLLFSGKRGIFHLTNEGECSRFEEALEVVKVDGLGADIHRVPSEKNPRPAKRPKYSVLDSSKAYEILGGALPDWRDALRRYLKESRRVSRR